MFTIQNYAPNGASNSEHLLVLTKQVFSPILNVTHQIKVKLAFKYPKSDPIAPQSTIFPPQRFVRKHHLNNYISIFYNQKPKITAS